MANGRSRQLNKQNQNGHTVTEFLPSESAPSHTPPKNNLAASNVIFGVSQNPGGFFWFWNAIVPLSVFLNIQHFGLRHHEAGLFLALCLNPYVLNFIIKYPPLAFVCLIFCMVWIERILRRWRWFQIYNITFFRGLLALAVFLSVPSLIMRYVWMPFYRYLSNLLKGGDTFTTTSDAETARDLIMLVIAVVLLLHSIYFYVSLHSKSLLLPRDNGRRDFKAAKPNNSCKNRSSPRQFRKHSRGCST